MDNLKLVIDYAYKFLSVPLHFGTFTFTPFSVFLGCFAISLGVLFIKKLFS